MTTVAPPSQSVRTLPEALRVFVLHGSPWYLALTSAAAVVGLVLVGQWSWGQVVVVAGVLALQPFTEWVIHVYVLHAKPVTVFGQTYDNHQARRHRAHHADPRNLDILFIPMRGHLAGFVVVAGFCLTLPDAGVRLAFILIAALSSLGYEWVHFLVHTDYKPRTAAYRRLWTGHRLHHFRNENYWFGVSRRFGDTVLRTNPAKEDVERSETCLTLAG